MDNEFSSHSINYENIAQAVETAKEQLPELATVSPHEQVRAALEREHGMARQETRESEQEGVAGEQRAGDHFPAYADSLSPEVKQAVEALIQVTLDKGIGAGIEAAKKSDPFVMDVYHDALVDKLVRELKEQKLL